MEGAFSGALSISVVIHENKNELRTQQEHNEYIIHPQNPP